MKKYILICCLIIMFQIPIIAQTDSNKLETIRTQADLISGNSRDVLTNFFQLALNDLIGDDKRFRFSSNLFALRLKTNESLNLDKHYIKNTFWRNSNIDFDIKVNEAFRFDGASIGYRYAIINSRDFTVSKKLGPLYLAKTIDFSKMNESISEYIDSQNFSAAKKKEMNKELNDNFLQSETMTFKDLNPEFKDLVTKALNIKLNDDFNYHNQLEVIYDSLIDEYKNKLLWTIGADASTIKTGLLHDANISSQASAGLVKMGKYNNLEFDLKSNLNISNDSLSMKKNDLKQRFQFEGSINYVFRSKEQKPVFEIKAGSTYSKTLKGTYVGLEPELFTLDGGIRLKITNTIWIPVAFKYDPKNSNLFGIISVKSNFDWLKSKTM